MDSDDIVHVDVCVCVSQPSSPVHCSVDTFPVAHVDVSEDEQVLLLRCQELEDEIVSLMSRTDDLQVCVLVTPWWRDPLMVMLPLMSFALCRDSSLTCAL